MMGCIDFAKDMQVVVLLGGQGTRLGKLTENTAKSMIDVNGKPFFVYMLKLLKWHGFRRFHFCVGYQSKQITEYFGDGRKFAVSINYTFDGKKPLGTAGALRKALDMLDEDFLVIYGDSYMDIDYNELIYKHLLLKNQSGTKGIMTIFQNNSRYDKSNVLFKNGGILAYNKENPTTEMNHIDYGVSILSKELISDIPENRYVDLAEIYSNAVNQGLMTAHRVRKRFYEIGTEKSLNEFKNFIQKKSQKQKAIILDRDGTINRIVFNKDTERLDSPLCSKEFKLIGNTTKALRILKSLGYLLIVATNQPAAAKGKTTLKELYNINDRMNEILEADGIVLDDMFMCPHHPTGSRIPCSQPFLIRNCLCRKPNSMMIRKLKSKHNIDVKKSYMAGDSHVDILAGQAQRLKTVFLGRFKCDSCQLLGDIKPTLVFKNLYEFAKYLEGENNENH